MNSMLASPAHQRQTTTLRHRRPSSRCASSATLWPILGCSTVYHVASEMEHPGRRRLPCAAGGNVRRALPQTCLLFIPVDPGILTEAWSSRRPAVVKVKRDPIFPECSSSRNPKTPLSISTGDTPSSFPINTSKASPTRSTCSNARRNTRNRNRASPPSPQHTFHHGHLITLHRQHRPKVAGRLPGQTAP